GRELRSRRDRRHVDGPRGPGYRARMVVEQPVFNPFDPEFWPNPYPTLAYFREHEPVHESPFGTWMLFRYDDVLRVLRDPHLSVEDAKADAPPALQNPER